MSPISSTMLKEMVRARGITGEPDSDGDYTIRFKPDDTHGCGDLAMVGIEGDNKDIFCVRMGIDRSFPLDEWKRVLMIVNDFNIKYRWPTAYVLLPESEDEKTFDVRCDYFVQCEGPVTQDMLNSWFSGVILGTDKLFTMLIVDNKIPLR